MSKATIRTRQAAMKRYFKYSGDKNLALHYPYKGFSIDVDGIEESFNVFTDKYSIVLTRESIGEIEDFSKCNKEEHAEYPIVGISNIFKTYFDQKNVKRIDLNSLITDVKNNGYRFKKTELGCSNSFTYVWKYKDTYGKIGILDQAFSIINDNDIAYIIFNGWNRPVFIENTIGIAAILPMHFTKKEGKNIIDMEKYMVEL